MAVQMKKRWVMEEFSLDPDIGLLALNGNPIRLARRPLHVLLYLIEHRDRTVSRTELLDRFWDGKDVYDDSLTKCIGAIRKALGDRSKEPRFIESRWAQGYRYIGPLEEGYWQAEAAPLVEKEKLRGVKIVFEEEVAVGLPAEEPTQTAVAPAVVAPSTQTRRTRRLAALAVLLAVMVIAAAWLFWHRSRTAGPTEAPAIRSIAVLPLKNLSGEESQEYFSDGLTDSFITELSRVEGLKVISRNSVLAFKGKDIDPREVGRRLNVATVLEGSLRRSGETVRVDVRLVDTGDGSVIWAGTSYNRELKDILAVQDEIACSVTAGLRLRLCGEGLPFARRCTNNVDAYEAYLKGRYYWNKRTADGLKKAIGYFEQAVRLDPNYALAYAGLASAYKLGVWYVPLSVSETLPRLKAVALRAVELDEQLPEAHEAMAEVASFEGRYADCMREVEQAIALNPGAAGLRHDYALGIALLGRVDNAIAESRLALELDPLSLVINTDVGWIYYLARRPDEAIAQYQKALELEPNFSLAHFDLALAYSQKGMHDLAVSEMLKAGDRGSEYLAGLGYIYGRAGRRDQALQELEKLKALSRKQYVPPYHFAWICTGLGQTEQSIGWLEKVYEEHTQHVVDFKMHPMFDPLRSHPAFQELVRKVGLPD